MHKKTVVMYTFLVLIVHLLVIMKIIKMHGTCIKIKKNKIKTSRRNNSTRAMHTQRFNRVVSFVYSKPNKMAQAVPRLICSIKKRKAIPLQACIGPEGCRRLRLPGFKTIDT